MDTISKRTSGRTIVQWVLTKPVDPYLSTLRRLSAAEMNSLLYGVNVLLASTHINALERARFKRIKENCEAIQRENNGNVSDLRT